MSHRWPSCRHSHTGFFDGTRTVVGRLGTVVGSVGFLIDSRLTNLPGREAMISYLLGAHHGDRPRDLEAAEIARSLGPVELTPDDTLWFLEMRERAEHLAAKHDPARDLPQLHSICEMAGQHGSQLRRFAAVALGVYKLEGWTNKDRYTLAKWQLYFSTNDHGRQVTLQYPEVPRDLFDVFNTSELLAGWLEEFTVVRDQARV